MKTVRKFAQTQSTNWVFTLNNYTQEECDSLPDLINRPGVFERSNSLVKAIAVSEEVGERNGTPHLQGYLQLSKKGIEKSEAQVWVHYYPRLVLHCFSKVKHFCLLFASEKVKSTYTNYVSYTFCDEPIARFRESALCENERHVC